MSDQAIINVVLVGGYLAYWHLRMRASLACVDLAREIVTMLTEVIYVESMCSQLSGDWSRLTNTVSAASTKLSALRAMDVDLSHGLWRCRAMRKMLKELRDVVYEENAELLQQMDH